MKRLSLIALAVALTIPAFAAERIFPVVGSTPGANGSRWQTEMLFHNTGAESIVLDIELHDATGATQAASLTIGPRQTRIVGNVIGELFGRQNATGALVITTDDIAARKLAVTARTFTGAGGMEFGQDVPSYDPAQALGEGDTGVVPGPADPLTARFNFGLYALDETTIEWSVVRANGDASATVERTYPAGLQAQYNFGISTLLGANPEPGDVVYARIRSGRAIVYGSTVNQLTNDPSFVDASRTRENLPVELVGVDLDENGTIDIQDANGDGILDAPVLVGTYGYPNYFRVVVHDPEGQTINLTIGTPHSDARLVDAAGTIEWIPSGALRGQSGSLLVEATDGIDTVTFTLPVIYR